MVKTKEQTLLEKLKALYYIGEQDVFDVECRNISTLINEIEQTIPTERMTAVKERFVRDINTRIVEKFKGLPPEKKNIILISEERINEFKALPLSSDRFNEMMNEFKKIAAKAITEKMTVKMKIKKTDSYINNHILTKDQLSSQNTYYKIVKNEIKPLMFDDFAVVLRAGAIPEIAELRECLSRNEMRPEKLLRFLESSTSFTRQSEIDQIPTIIDSLRHTWSDVSFESNKVFMEILISKIEKRLNV